MRRNFFGLAKKPTLLDPVDAPRPGRMLPAWFKIFPVIVVQAICRHTGIVARLNGTYALPFHDVLISAPDRGKS